MVGPSLLPNMWQALGFGYGIVHGGGVGKYLADWITTGEAPFELIEFDPLRYGKWTTLDYALAKTRESYGMNNAFGYPYEERLAGRPTQRVTPLYETLKSQGAHMGFAAGWEVPLWYAAPGETPEYKPSFFRTNWQVEQSREYDLITNKVGIADLSTFGKFEVTGPDSRKFLDYAVAGTVPKVGRTSLVHMLTDSAKVYAELTVTCLEENRFLVITGGGSELHDLRQLNQTCRGMNADVRIKNVTEDYGVISIAGPRADTLLARVTDIKVEDWKFLDARSGTIGGVDCCGVRITYTGELGWELYVKMKDMKALYESLVSQGEDLELGHFGTRVVNTLRIEKGFRAWGHEMNKDTTPIETGLMPFVRLKKKADFVGKSALLKLLQKVPTRRVVHLAMDAATTDVEPEGDETILCEGKPVGYTTSGCWSPVLGSGLSMASLPCYLAVPGTQVQVMLAGIPRNATVLSGAPALTHSARNASQSKQSVRKEMAQS